MGNILESFVKLTAPTNKIDFVAKLTFFMLIGGSLHHFRHVLAHGLPVKKTFWANFSEAAFTTLPMCSLALMLFGHLALRHKRLHQQATRDDLTNLPNRRWFMDNTPQTIRSSERIMIIDVDRFKTINDTFGHDVGDRCLQEVGAHLKRSVGPKTKLARIGGEEFAAFIPNVDDRELGFVAQRICVGFDFDPGNRHRHRITFSIGIASFDKDETRCLALKRADQAVYRAKSAGRSKYATYTASRQDFVCEDLLVLAV